MKDCSMKYNFATKVASNEKYLKRDHVTPLLRDLKWINFNSIVRLNEASFMYKNLHVSADSNVKNINFDLQNMVSERITINGSDVHIDYRRTALGQKAVLVSGAKLWNSIPMNIRNSNTRRTFKSHVYQHLLNSWASITIWEQSQTFLIKIGPSSVPSHNLLWQTLQCKSIWNNNQQCQNY